MGDYANALSRHFRHAAGGAERTTTDAELLARFSQNRDEPAFAELVRRYGPMVLRVCRRLAGSDADDAFQAVFLVLARKADRFRSRSALGAWLHEVAHRAALKVRATAARRRVRETAAARPEGMAPSEPSDALGVIEEELRALPRRYREPLVMCAVCGRARKEVADELGVAEGTLSSRLAKARELLAARLRRRGVAVPALGGLASGELVARDSVAPQLAEQAVKIATGKAPVAVECLASEVTRAMLLNKLRVAVIVALAITACAAGLLARPQATGTSTPSAPVADEKPGRLNLKDFDQKVTDAKRDLAGVWELQRQFVDGKAIALESEYYRYTFGEHTLKIEAKHRGRGQEIKVEAEMSYTVNPTTRLPQLTAFAKGTLLQSIYELKGDELKIARHGRADVERPRGFTLTDNRVRDMSLTVWEFKRAVGVKPPAPERREK